MIPDGEAVIGNLLTERWFQIEAPDLDGSVVTGWTPETRIRVREETDASGCGKTTLLRTITGLGMADEGRISIGGRDVTYLPPRERKLSMVFQSVDKAEMDRRVRESAELLHLEDLLDRYPSKMSGGQRQRVAVARAYCYAGRGFAHG